MTEQERFEQWAKPDPVQARTTEEGDYFDRGMVAAWNGWMAAKRDTAAEVEHLRADNAKLKTVMVAAAEEISAHWDAHCDEEGYGPVNLQRRLEAGIPSEYGYTAGDFERLRSEVEALRKDAARYRWIRQQHWEKSLLCVVKNPKSAVKPGHDCPSLDRLDAAIDTAMKSEQSRLIGEVEE